MTREEAHKLVDQLFDSATLAPPSAPETQPDEIPEEPTPERVKPENKRVVRTKNSGDRVYYLDEEAKTRRWITNPQVLDGLGFVMDDVEEIEDSEMLKYSMGPALYQVNE